MKLKEVMSTDVEVIAPEATLDDAARMMRSGDLGSLPICDGRKLQGMITDRDIVIRAIAQGLDPRMTQAKDIMSEGVAYCFEDQEDSEARSLMEDKNIRRLIVLDRNKNLVGLVSIGDLGAKSDNVLADEVLRSQYQAPGQV